MRLACGGVSPLIHVCYSEEGLRRRSVSPNWSAWRRSCPQPHRLAQKPRGSNAAASSAEIGFKAVMSRLERVLVAGSTDLPDCRCSAEMRLIAVVPVPGDDSEVRVFQCEACHHELRLTVWHNDMSGTRNIERLLSRGRSGRDL